MVGDTVVVRKQQWATGREVMSWTGTLVELTGERAVVEARFGQPGVQIDGVRVSAGDRFTEFYFFGRYYNVFHIADREGRAKGWYCNLSRPPELHEDGISFVDLLLDVFVHPDGRFAVLDEEEFAQARRRSGAREEVQRAHEALAEILDLARRGELPEP